jgi:hypothetical protein
MKSERFLRKNGLELKKISGGFTKYPGVLRFFVKKSEIVPDIF